MNNSDSPDSTLVVLGAGGLASEVLDAIRVIEGLGNVQVFSDIPPSEGNLDTDLVDLFQGPVDMALERFRNFRFVVAIGDPTARARIHAAFLSIGAMPQTLIHPTASIGCTSTLGPGSIVLPGATITTRSTIDSGCVVNPGVRVSHDSHVGSFTTLGPNAVLCGFSSIGDRCLIGASATVNPGIAICDDVVLGAGSVASRPISSPGVWAGAPAKPPSAP